MEMYVNMPIRTTAWGKEVDLIEWYLLKNPQRRTADGVEMCVTEEEVAAQRIQARHRGKRGFRARRVSV